MTEDKYLYFIPIIARALGSNDPKWALEEAFDEIRELGNQPGYMEGFRQFQEFLKTALMTSGDFSRQEVQSIESGLYGIIYDLATDTFEGNEEQKEALITALTGIPKWKTEYDRIKQESEALLPVEIPIEVEVLRENEVVGSLDTTATKAYVEKIMPGRYVFRLSNGRVLWEGNLAKEDVLWAFAFPEKDLPMAAKTEPAEREPTRTISLLNGELIIEIFAGLESGEMRLRIGQDA